VKLLPVLLLALLGMTKAHAQEMKTVEDRVAEFGDTVRQRLAPKFEEAGVEYPPTRLAFIGIKHTRELEVYAANANGPMTYICTYPVLAASGVLGPKLREGDRQVPEGIYRIRELNPNSLFHLSLWIDYPNAYDCAYAEQEGRTEPGGEIMIHGKAASRGCLAVGDPAAEDLFVLAALTGIRNIDVILTPVDFRAGITPELPATAPVWTSELHENIERALANYPPSQQKTL
jgi:murein L,D-transpeptidase YafK